MSIKCAIATAVLVSMAGAATAMTTALGAAAVGSPLTFGGLAAPGPFLNYFTFSLPPNGGSGYSVSNFALLPGVYNTIFTSLKLVSSADGLVGTLDDSVVASAISIGSSALNLSFGSNGGGNYHLEVVGNTNGGQGGIYNGAISVTAIPEPETYALMLAGLGAVGFVVARRRPRV